MKLRNTIMLLVVILAVPLWAEEAILEDSGDTTELYTYAIRRHVWLDEMAGGAGGFFIALGTFSPLGWALHFGDYSGWGEPSVPRWVIIAYDVTAITTVTTATALGTWRMGKMRHDEGSFIGAFLGAAVGEVAWYFSPAIIPDLGLASILLYYSSFALIPLGSWGGYKLIPPIKCSEKSRSGLNLVPQFDANGVGVSLSLRF